MMKKMLRKISVWVVTGVIAICGVLAISSSTTYAATIRDNACTGVNLALGTGGNCDSYSIDSVWVWVYRIINWVLIAVGIIAVVFIIIGAVKFQTSGGEPDKVKSAKSTLIYSIIGLVVAILAEVIVQIVFSTVGTVTGS